MGNENFFNMTPAERKLRAQAKHESLAENLENLPRKVQDYYKQVPKAYQMIFLKVHSEKKASATNAIKLKCLDCCCWEREEIRLCTVKQCGLWRIRPYK